MSLSHDAQSLTTTEEPMPLDPDGELLRPLSPREGEVARLLGRGMAYKAIGATLGVSTARVRAIVYLIAEKLPEVEDVSPSTRAFMWAVCRAHWRGELRVRKIA